MPWRNVIKTDDLFCASQNQSAFKKRQRDQKSRKSTWAIAAYDRNGTFVINATNASSSASFTVLRASPSRNPASQRQGALFRPHYSTSRVWLEFEFDINDSFMIHRPQKETARHIALALFGYEPTKTLLIILRRRKN